jgi:hypothetical protein
MELQQYIARAFPDGLSYNDMAQLCLRLYGTVEGMPSELHAQCSKDNLVEVFSRLAGSGFIKDDIQTSSLYGANFHSENEKGHWVEVIASIFRSGDTVDMLVGESLARTLNNAFKADVARATCP